jgi:hypothetical protein
MPTAKLLKRVATPALIDTPAFKSWFAKSKPTQIKSAIRSGFAEGDNRITASQDYHDLPVVKSETWDDGITRTWVASPFPKLRTRVDLPRNSDIQRAVEKTVDLSTLQGTQPVVTVNGMDKPRDDSHGLPLVVHSNGVNYIQDGHHRLSKDYFEGKTHARVRYVDLDTGKTAKLLIAGRPTPMIHEKGCVMLRPDEATAKKVLQVGRAIVKDDEVYTDPKDPSFGRETTPHSTCLWGLTEVGVGDRVAAVAAKFAPRSILIKNVTFFPAGDKPYDVVKFDIGEQGMKEFHDALLAEFPDTKETFDYHPHMTISYVHAGLGAKVCRRAAEWAGRRVPVACIVYSSQDGSETLYDLSGTVIKG